MRVLVTVGAQMPFDRLVSAVERWALRHPEHEVFAQVGAQGRRPSAIASVAMLSPSELAREYDAADGIVGHAGIGTIFAALERGKALVVMPRRAALRETRNDHQVATARRFAELAGVVVAYDERELPSRLDHLAAAVPRLTLRGEAKGPLIRALAARIAAR
jgi:UDP-N-acetylglucosamine transferase subunit ALG13